MLSGWSTYHISLRTMLQMVRTHGKARWAWWPACDPSTQEVEERILGACWLAGLDRVVKFQVLWKPLSQYIRWSRKPLSINYMLPYASAHTYTCAYTHDNMYVHMKKV